MSTSALQAPEPKDCFHTSLQYAGLRCFTCNTPSNLSACSRCKRVKYCSSTCQKADFTTHAPFCRAWSSICQSRSPLSQPRVATPGSITLSELVEQMAFTASSTMNPLDIAMKGKKGDVSNYLAFKEPRCGVCLRLESKENRCKVCEGCGGLWRYCEEGVCEVVGLKEHRKEGALCEELREIIENDELMLAHEKSNAYDGSFVHFAPDRICRTYTPLPSDWSSYFSSAAPQLMAAPPALLRCHTSHQLSLPLTLIAALERFSLASRYSDPSNKRDLTVHLLGAQAAYELLLVGTCWEEVLHLLPGVGKLSVVMVGPTELGKEVGQEIEMDCCPTCTKDGRRRTVEIHGRLYHEYHSSLPYSAPSPDLCIAFNAGLSEPTVLANWSPTLSVLTALKVATAITSFCSTEAIEDVKAIKRKLGSRVEWVWEAELNVWRSGRKSFDLLSADGTWTTNMYWIGFRGVD